MNQKNDLSLLILLRPISQRIGHILGQRFLTLLGEEGEDVFYAVPISQVVEECLLRQGQGAGLPNAFDLGPLHELVQGWPSGAGSWCGRSGAASLGKYLAPTDPATGAARDAQIVATFGHPCSTTTTTRKIDRPPKRGTR